MSVRQQEFRKFVVIFGFVCLFFAMVIFAAGAVSAESPANDHVANTSVFVGDSVNQSVFVDVEFSQNSTAYVELVDPNGSDAGNETLNGDSGSTQTAEFSVSQDGTYEVSISGNNDAIEEAWVSTDAESDGEEILAGGGGSSGGSYPSYFAAVGVAALLALAAAVGLLTRVDL